ncbi:MAG TPA: hypothetical protein VK465_19010 [Fibrobacteria bacterium]|nr:hypothetical protein [Fibrobacteria bacterium]
MNTAGELVGIDNFQCEIEEGVNRDSAEALTKTFLGVRGAFPELDKAQIVLRFVNTAGVYAFVARSESGVGRGLILVHPKLRSMSHHAIRGAFAYLMAELLFLNQATRWMRWKALLTDIPESYVTAACEERGFQSELDAYEAFDFPEDMESEENKMPRRGLSRASDGLMAFALLFVVIILVMGMEKSFTKEFMALSNSLVNLLLVLVMGLSMAAHFFEQPNYIRTVIRMVTCAVVLLVLLLLRKAAF